MIDSARAEDAAAIAAIYNHYIANTVVTFEEEPVAAADMARRLVETREADLPWLVARGEAGEVAGYAYASSWKGRCSYRHSVEVTIYLSPGAGGKGLGTRLYEALFSELRARSMHVLIAGIALPNPASIALHEKLGMEKVGHFREVGSKMGRWIDVGYWQLVLAG